MAIKKLSNSDINLSQGQLKFNPKTEVLEETDSRISKTLKYNYEMEIKSDKVCLNKNNIFCYVKPVCPLCGRCHVIKYGTMSTSKFNDHRLKFNYNVQLY